MNNNNETKASLNFTHLLDYIVLKLIMLNIPDYLVGSGESFVKLLPSVGW